LVLGSAAFSLRVPGIGETGFVDHMVLIFDPFAERFPPRTVNRAKAA